MTYTELEIPGRQAALPWRNVYRSEFKLLR